MPDPLVPSRPGEPEPEARLELTRPGGRQIWALYSQPPPHYSELGSPETPLSVFLHDLPGIAWRGRRILQLSLLLSLALGALYLITAESVYYVQALVLVERRDSSFQDAGVPQGGNAFMATQAEILHSPPIARDALRASGVVFGASDEPSAVSRLVSWLRSLVLPPEAPGDPEPGRVLKALEALEASPVLGTSVIAIAFRTEEPGLGVRFVDALIATYGDFVRGIERGGHDEALALLSEQEGELGARVLQLEEEYARLRAQGASMGDEQNALSVQKARLEEQARLLVAAQGQRIQLENELAATRRLEETGEEALAELARAELELADLEARYTDAHPSVRRARARVAALRVPLPASSTTQVTALEQRVEAARDTEAQLAALYRQEVENAKVLDDQLVKERYLDAALTDARAAHQSVLEVLRQKQLRVGLVANERAGVIVRTLESASPSDEPVWPLPVPVLAACGLVGLLGGLALAVLDDRRRSGRRLYATAADSRRASAASL